MPIRQRVAVLNEPPVEIQVIEVTPGEDLMMPVTGSTHAPDRCSSNFVHERMRRDRAAGIRAPCCVPACLCGVRRINPFQPDACRFETPGLRGPNLIPEASWPSLAPGCSPGGRPAPGRGGPGRRQQRAGEGRGRRGPARVSRLSRHDLGGRGTGISSLPGVVDFPLVSCGSLCSLCHLGLYFFLVATHLRPRLALFGGDPNGPYVVK